MSTEVTSASVPPEVFISYSSVDRDKISPIVQIVRAMKKGLVFQDSANIIPGERWRERVMDAIQKAMTLVVFTYWRPPAPRSVWSFIQKLMVSNPVSG